jgi:hypothetical protein
MIGIPHQSPVSTTSMRPTTTIQYALFPVLDPVEFCIRNGTVFATVIVTGKA